MNMCDWYLMDVKPYVIMKQDNSDGFSFNLGGDIDVSRLYKDFKDFTYGDFKMFVEHNWRENKEVLLDYLQES